MSHLQAAPDALDVGALHAELLIDGEWAPAQSDARFGVDDPSTGLQFTTVADAGAEDAVRAVDAAAARFSEFSNSIAFERARLLNAAHDMLLERADHFALLITVEMGKPLAEAYGEVSYAAEFLEWFAGAALRLDGTARMLPDGSGQMIVVPEPVGVCVLITPWNFPLAMVTRKVAPALAAGCTAVVKPAPQAPLTALAFGRLLLDAGVAPGVVNVLPSDQAPAVVRALLAHPQTRKLSFTGSTEVGRLLLEQAARGVLRTSMELGGNAPFLVFDDADLEAAIQGALVAKLRNGGQACTAANRFLVHASVAPAFSQRLAARFAAAKLGPGMSAETEVGPLIDDPAVTKVSALVDDARARGAAILVGGEAVTGRFFAPTVLTDVPADARIHNEEIFGPVAAISTFDSEDEAIKRANDTEHGLVSYVFTRDVGRARRVGAAMQSGMVAINRGLVSSASAPFGGIKASGIGREGGNEGIDEYVQLKYVALDTA
jgi:succinate-semialdehyde dehydrogenase/glutarate-semialdehyde dehydrogenase